MNNRTEAYRKARVLAATQNQNLYVCYAPASDYYTVLNNAMVALNHIPDDNVRAMVKPCGCELGTTFGTSYPCKAHG